MDFRGYVERNQKVIDFVRDVTPGHIDKYVGTLDYACARFNTMLLKLSQDPLNADLHKHQVRQCFEIIQNFYKWTRILTNSHWIYRPLVKLMLYYKGKIQIPKIKLLLETTNK